MKTKMIVGALVVSLCVGAADGLISNLLNLKPSRNIPWHHHMHHAK